MFVLFVFSFSWQFYYYFLNITLPFYTMMSIINNKIIIDNDNVVAATDCLSPNKGKAAVKIHQT